MKTNILPSFYLTFEPDTSRLQKKPLTNVNGGGVGPLWLNSDGLILSYWQPANWWHGPFLRMTRVDSLHANARFYWKFNKRFTWERKPGARDTRIVLCSCVLFCGLLKCLQMKLFEPLVLLFFSLKVKGQKIWLLITVIVYRTVLLYVIGQ